MREVGHLDHASTEQLSALVDERVEPEEQHLLTGHIQGCLTCASELSDLRTVRNLLRSLPVILPPRSFVIPAESEIGPASSTRSRFGKLIPITRYLGALAAVFCVVLFSVDATTMGLDWSTPAPGAPASASRPLSNSTAAKPAPKSAAESVAKPAESKPAAPAAMKPGISSETAARVTAATAPARAPATAATEYPAAAQAAQAKPADSAPQAAGQAANAPAPAAPPPPQPTAGTSGPPQSFAPPAQPAQSAPITAAAPAGEPAIAPATAVPPGVGLPAPSDRTSPWLSPTRLWIIGLAVAAVLLLAASFVFSRLDRSRTSTGAARR